MCGIAGIISKKDKFTNNQVIEKFEKSIDLLKHRGPDNFGKFIDNQVALFHFRLSILDLNERSNQPFISQNKQLISVYNGEVYNYQDLAKLYNLYQYTSSDTEIVTESFSKFGLEAVQHWNGIFAAVFYDKKKNEITLIRDRYGVKPLYIFEDESYLLFSSEAKVILDWLPEFELDKQGLSEYLWYGNTISNHTLVRGLKKIAPASSLTINIKSFSKKNKKYWKNEGTINNPPSFNTAVNQTRNLLENAVKRQLISDVPIGVLLSGGIDSSAVTAFASRHYEGRLNTYSIEFDYNKGGISELEKARLISKTFNTKHHELKIESKHIHDIIKLLVVQYDEPFADSANIPLYLITKEIKGKHKVVLQGDGGDEIFGGYRRYSLLHYQQYYKYLFGIGQYLLKESSSQNRIKRLSKIFWHKDEAKKMALLLTPDTEYQSPLSILNSEWKEKINNCDPFIPYRESNKRYKTENDVQKMLYTDLDILLPNTYLEKVDKSTMLNSIEARVPFLDHELSSFAISLPTNYKVRKGYKKYLLKKALHGVLPNSILNSPKRGFGVPYEKWLQTTLYEFAREQFQTRSTQKVLSTNYLINKLDEHRTSNNNNGFMLWKALILSIWLNHYNNKIQ